MAYAIIETGGKQLRVEPGRFYDVERLPVGESEEVTIDRVLFVENDGEFSVGQPWVAGAAIQGTVMRHLRGRKIIVYKMRPKKKTRKKQGHRQELTRLMINSISLNGMTLGFSEGTQKATPVLAAESAEDSVAPVAVAESSEDFAAPDLAAESVEDSIESTLATESIEDSIDSTSAAESVEDSIAPDLATESVEDSDE
jgi:large subunit ribosomal protein L21